VTWSRTRFTGYCLLVMDSKPGWRPARLDADRAGLSEDGSELTGNTREVKGGHNLPGSLPAGDLR